MDWRKLDVDATASDLTGKLVHELVVERALEAPDAPAVVARDHTVTYRELNERSDHLAHRLAELGVGPEIPVCVHLERSPELIISYLAVLKAGGAYLPLDPAYPAQALHYMLEDCGAAVLITSTAHQDDIPPSRAHRLSIDGPWTTEPLTPSVPPLSSPGPDNAAYLVYTSGSTNHPKGITVEHRSFLNLAVWEARFFELTSADRGSLVSSLSFDASVWEIWPILITGGCLVAIDELTRADVGALVEWLRTERITSAYLPPALAKPFFERTDIESLDLRWLSIGGDVLRRRPRPGMPFRAINAYGPSEATSITTVAKLADRTQEEGPIPIGYPLGNYRVYLMDEDLRPVSDGTVGEIFVAGVGVARGYINRPGLTAEKFLPDPFSPVPGARMYRTGDLGVRRPDGALEFQGRTDRQIKVRGYRIEPAQIEVALLDHPGVYQTAVVAQQINEVNELVAFVVPQRDWSPQDDLAAEHRVKWRSAMDGMVIGDEVTEESALSGWHSSFDGSPIPPEAMRDWQLRTVESVRGLGGDRLLEVGCGTGLILTEVAPYFKACTGADFAPKTIAALRRRVAKLGLADRVEVLVRDAADWSQVPDQGYDTVVINSVAQYFPGEQYLRDVLVNAVRATADGGSVFVGDVRSLALRELFASALTLYGASPDLSLDRAAQGITERMGQERELLIAPRLFTDLPAILPRVTAVEIRPKRTGFATEMTDFRYDAVLRVGGPVREPLPVTWYSYREHNLDLDELRDLLTRTQEKAIGVRGIPNLTLAEHHAALRAVQDRRFGTVGELRATLADNPPDGVSLEALFELAEKTGFQLEVSWAASHEDGAFDAVWRRPGVTGRVEMPTPPGEGTLVNQPLRAARDAVLVRELREFLSGRLPTHMVPHLYSVLDEFPINPAGKIDRDRLSTMSTVQLGSDTEYVAPDGPVEEAVADIIAEVLNIDRVGLRHNVFHLGAHSLSVAQVLNRISEVFEVEVRLRDVFTHPTVEEIAILVQDAVIASAERELAQADESAVS